MKGAADGSRWEEERSCEAVSEDVVAKQRRKLPNLVTPLKLRVSAIEPREFFRHSLEALINCIRLIYG